MKLVLKMVSIFFILNRTFDITLRKIQSHRNRKNFSVEIDVCSLTNRSFKPAILSDGVERNCNSSKTQDVVINTKLQFKFHTEIFFSWHYYLYF